MPTLIILSIASVSLGYHVRPSVYTTFMSFCFSCLVDQKFCRHKDLQSPKHPTPYAHSCQFFQENLIVRIYGLKKYIHAEVSQN